jgi:prophage regulatory protein
MTQGLLQQKFLRLPQVTLQTGKSRASIYAAMKRGEFPQSVRIGPRAVAWTASSVQAWQEACIKASQA